LLPPLWIITRAFSHAARGGSRAIEGLGSAALKKRNVAKKSFLVKRMSLTGF
jgi:hypothetical protein